ncbi:hypothetical protein K9M41_03785 [Candidatus Gracilibacteria bacterium]|nr:hypothetical protein [Candidatus Gracilibacteria bacterium]
MVIIQLDDSISNQIRYKDSKAKNKIRKLWNDVQESLSEKSQPLFSVKDLLKI